jgi:putative membrane protein
MMMEQNDKLYQKLKIASLLISMIVLSLVGLMRRVKIDLGFDFSFLPPIHALLNTIVAIFLVLAFLAIKKKDIVSHRKYIYGAMICSAMFLLCYVLYHFTTEETKFCKDGWIRTVYFIFLISHIVLAALSLPFILLTFSRGISFQVEEHKKMAKWVFPIWLYVALTGPICYIMLKPCFS